MPELPEVETVRGQLAKALSGHTISEVIVHAPRMVTGEVKDILKQSIQTVRRFGKVLVIDCTGNISVVIHFKMSGQLILIQKDGKRIAGGHPSADWVQALPSAHTRVTFLFANGDTLYFNDQRFFGWIKIMPTDTVAELSYLKHLGPEPWDIADDDFFSRIHKKNKAIKLVILDQEIISGVGNIYANDALWEASLHPETIAKQLTKEQVSRLQSGIITVLKDGIRYKGATAADAKYVHLDGMLGTYQHHARVYDRTGESCRRNDGGIIEKFAVAGRGTYICPVCQKKQS